jgi:N-acyl-D-amino-acid deacylase
LVTGNCGSGHLKTKQFYDKLEENGVGINVAHLLPNGALRNAVMGKVRRAPTEYELQLMEELT